MTKRTAGSGQRAEKTGKCPSCGGADFEEGTIALYNSISYMVFSSEKRPFVTLGNSLRSRVCLGCGRVELFAPRKDFGKERNDREP
jgi:predicted nucleic-acid-binding Zn-ribbon protein